MIETRKLHKKFGEKVAVDDISFVAPDGAVTALLGPNGAGKGERVSVAIVVPQAANLSPKPLRGRRRVLLSTVFPRGR